MNEIKDMIKKYRAMKNISQADLADRIGVATSKIAAYETGARIPKVEARSDIAKALNVDPIALSGIEISQYDEKRLLNKLISKYCKNIEIVQSDKNCEKSVKVTLDYDFVPVANIYEENVAGKKDIEESQLDDATKIRLNMEADAEQEFWLECWPDYDYVIQGRIQGVDPEDGGKYSLKETLKSNFIADFERFKASKYFE